MHNSVAKKLFAVGVAASTVLALVPFAASAAPHGAGTNVLSSDGTVWMITANGTRRAYTSGGAFLSYGFNSFATVVPANADDLALPVDAAGFIPPQDGSIMCSDRSPDQGTCYEITGGQKAGFTSQAVFTGLGFSFANSKSGDVSFLPSTAHIDNTTSAHRPGTLVNNNGTILLIGANGTLGIPDQATFASWGYSYSKVVPANAADKALPMVGVMAARVASQAQLSPSGIATNPTTPAPAPGTVYFSASGSQTPQSSVPEQATNVNVLKFMVTNGNSSPATVTQVTVKRTGAGSTSNISNVFLYQGASRLTSGRSINSSTNEAVFSGLSIVVPANGSVTLDVLVDIANGATGTTHQFSVTSVMLGSTAATGSAMGNPMNIANVDVGTVTIAKTGTITNPKVGQQGARVASFTLNASSSEDMVVKRITLLQAGAVTSSYLSNLQLKQAGNTLATIASLDSKDKANFEVNFALAKGDTRTFEVYADISGAARTGSSETIKFYVEETSDIFAVGQTYGFGGVVSAGDYDNSTACTSSSGDCSYSYVEGGQLTITFNGPAAKDIAKNGKDIEVFNFTMAAQNTLEVRQMVFTFNNGGSGTADLTDGTNPLYTDIKIVDASTGAVVWGPQDISGSGSDTTQNITFSEDIVLAAGTSKTFKVTLDTANDSDFTAGRVIAATLDVDSLTSNDVKNLDNNTFLTSTDVVPTGDIAGNQMTNRIASLETALASNPSSASFVKGSSGVSAAGFVFTASTAADIRVTDVALSAYIASSTSDTMHLGSTTNSSATTIYASDNITTVELYDGATKLGETKSFNTSGAATFNGLNWVITKGTSKTLTVKINLANSANSSNILKVALAAGSVTAVDPEGNEVVDTSGATTTKPDAALNAASGVTTGTAITVSGNGTIAVAAAGVTQDVNDARIVLAGTSGVTLGKIRFTASSEELKLTKVRINVASASGSTGAGAANIADDINALYLYDGATLIAGPVSLTPSGTTEGYASFTGMAADFIIGKDASKDLTIKGDLNTIGASYAGADSGDEFAVWLDASNDFEVRGTSGSTVRTAPDSGTYTGNYVVLRKSQPKVETVPMTGGPATGTIYRFKITAIGGDVAVKHITFVSSTTTGVTLTGFAISPQGGTNLSVATAATYTTNQVTVDVTFASEEVITNGTSKTYDFKATVAGVDTGDSVTTYIVNTANTVKATGDLASASAADTTLQDKDGTNSVGDKFNDSDTTPSFVWSDMSINGHNDTASGTDDWTNGRYVRTIATDPITLSN